MHLSEKLVAVPKLAEKLGNYENKFKEGRGGQDSEQKEILDANIFCCPTYGKLGTFSGVGKSQGDREGLSRIKIFDFLTSYVYML